MHEFLFMNHIKMYQQKGWDSQSENKPFLALVNDKKIWWTTLTHRNAFQFEASIARLVCVEYWMSLPYPWEPSSSSRFLGHDSCHFSPVILRQPCKHLLSFPPGKKIENIITLIKTGHDTKNFHVILFWFICVSNDIFARNYIID